MNKEQVQVIKYCQQSPSWFLENFGKIKHPSAGVLPYKPFSYQKKAIKAFRTNRLNIFRKCFAAGSMVWTPTGPKPIETIKSGDRVYAYDEHSASVVISKVKAAWSHEDRSTVVVRTKTGHRSVCTPDHDFLTRNGWVEAGSLTPNDILTEVYEPVRYAQADESEAILLGYLITDGCYSNSGNGYQFHFTNTNWKYLLEYQKHFEKRFNKRLSIKLHNKAGTNKSKKNSYRILSSDGPAREWLKSLGMWGQKAANKHLPDVVFTWNNVSIALLLNRMFAGDGWYAGSHCNEVGIGSESELLLHQVKQLLSRFNIDAKFYPANKSSLAKLRIFGTDNFTRFVDQIGIFGKEQRHYPITRGFFRNRVKGQIKSIKPSTITKVYDLEIEEYHNFIVDGVVVHNCRQAGISKIAGAFALWFAMMHNSKKILIVSRKNDDAMSFLKDHIVFLFENLPDWMQEIWTPKKQNEHEIEFPNNSRIQSLTSHPDVLRSHASSLVIIDEAAFIPNMDAMWSSGWPTLQHGGNVIVISTTSGIGGWYWSTMSEAESGESIWNPIVINWWDMDWAIEYEDPLTKDFKRIAPRAGIRKCDTKKEIEKYGPYWSPWLEEQWKALQEQGDDWKFKQEILAEFVGSGNTIIERSVLAQMELTVRQPTLIVSGEQSYEHPVTGQQVSLNYTFDSKEEGLWIWEKPVVYVPAKKSKNGSRSEGGQTAHSYVMGVDIATGKGKDYSTIEVFDVNTSEQVAEFMARVLPRDLALYADRIGRYYNNATMVVERNNGGDIVIDELRLVYKYPALWRKKELNDKPMPGGALRRRPVKVAINCGFMTSSASKPYLNKLLIDHFKDSEDSWVVRSTRLKKQFETYVRKRDRAGRDTNKTEAEEGVNNFDDLVIATALALVGANDNINTDTTNLLPVGSNTEFVGYNPSSELITADKMMEKGLMMPMQFTEGLTTEEAASQMLNNFMAQLGSVPSTQHIPTVNKNKLYYRKK